MSDQNPDICDLLTLRAGDAVGTVIARRLVDRFGSASEALAAPLSDLAGVDGLSKRGAERLIASVPSAREQARAELATCHRLGITPLSLWCEAYPSLLGSIPDPPVLLFVKGNLDPEAMGLGIVGSRKATAYGIEQAERFASHLAQHEGLTIVSGGARGIDTAAHRAALRVSGRTVAVLGCGHSVAYPPENADLFETIASTGGAVVSEHPPSTPPAREHFPPRNRIISGLSLGVLIIEAPARSGALITARLAIEEHGREALAVPGRVDSAASRGTNELLRSGGAGMALSPADVAEALDAPGRHLLAGTHSIRYPAAENGSTNDRSPSTAGRDPVVPSEGATDFAPGRSTLSEAQRNILQALENPGSPDELARRTGIEIAQIRADATILEMRRLVRWRGAELERV